MHDFEYYRYAVKNPRRYFQYFLKSCEWKEGFYKVAGMEIKYPRLMTWFDATLPWPPLLLELKRIAEKYSGTEFNAALLNLYRDGNDSVGWHSDREMDREENPTIVSLSLGAPRKFMIKNKKTKRVIMIMLEPGDILIMREDFQKNYVHSVPKMRTIDTPRINITFRNIQHSLIEV